MDPNIAKNAITSDEVLFRSSFAEFCLFPSVLFRGK